MISAIFRLKIAMCYTVRSEFGSTRGDTHLGERGTKRESNSAYHGLCGVKDKFAIYFSVL